MRGSDATPTGGRRIPVLQILAVAVAIRVGNATGTTLLKGAGEHRLRRVREPRHRRGQRRCSASLLIKALRPHRRGLRHADPDRRCAASSSSTRRVPPRRRAAAAGPSLQSILPAALAGFAVAGLLAVTRAHLIRHASGCCMSGSGWRRALPGAVLRRGDRQARPRRSTSPRRDS